MAPVASKAVTKTDYVLAPALDAEEAVYSNFADIPPPQDVKKFKMVSVVADSVELNGTYLNHGNYWKQL